MLKAMKNGENSGVSGRKQPGIGPSGIECSETGGPVLVNMQESVCPRHLQDARHATGNPANTDLSAMLLGHPKGVDHHAKSGAVAIRHLSQVQNQVDNSFVNQRLQLTVRRLQRVPRFSEPENVTTARSGLNSSTTNWTAMPAKVPRDC